MSVFFFLSVYVSVFSLRSAGRNFMIFGIGGSSIYFVSKFQFFFKSDISPDE
jgi:hypothetical protein